MLPYKLNAITTCIMNAMQSRLAKTSICALFLWPIPLTLCYFVLLWAVTIIVYERYIEQCYMGQIQWCYTTKCLSCLIFERSM